MELNSRFVSAAGKPSAGVKYCGRDSRSLTDSLGQLHQVQIPFRVIAGYTLESALSGATWIVF